MTRKILLRRDLLTDARREANSLRDRYQAANLVCFNLVSSPGSGKTSLLEQTLRFFGQKHQIGLIAGDVQTTNDADRLQAEGGALVAAAKARSFIENHVGVYPDDIQAVFASVAGHRLKPAGSTRFRSPSELCQHVIDSVAIP